MAVYTNRNYVPQADNYLNKSDSESEETNSKLNNNSALDFLIKQATKDGDGKAIKRLKRLKRGA